MTISAESIETDAGNSVGVVVKARQYVGVRRAGSGLRPAPPGPGASGCEGPEPPCSATYGWVVR